MSSRKQAVSPEGEKSVAPKEDDAEIRSIVHGRVSAAAVAEINTHSEELEAAVIHIGKPHRELNPRDLIQEMLIDKLAATHARVIKLSAQSMIQRDQGWHRAMSEACDRAANTFRRRAAAKLIDLVSQLTDPPRAVSNEPVTIEEGRES